MAEERRWAPRPTHKEVLDIVDDWEDRTVCSVEARVANTLKGLCPNNRNIVHVLLKESAISGVYCMNVIPPFVKHIYDLNIDDRLKAGDPTLVDDMARVESNGMVRRFYSLASKYCNFHNPDYYPIYDPYISRALMYFKKVDKFATFSSKDLKSYPSYYKILEDFREFYTLRVLNLNTISRYLSEAGKRYAL